MFTERTDEIVRQFLTFVDITADLTYPARLAFRLRLRLDILLVVRVGHCLFFGEDSGFRHGTDKHSMCAQIHVILDFQGHEGVDVLGQEDEPIIRTQFIFTLSELVHVPAALESECLEHLERSFH